MKFLTTRMHWTRDCASVLLEHRWPAPEMRSVGRILMIEPAKRERLLRLIRAQPEYGDGRALVTVSEFFDGNDDLGSIGCNLSDHPGVDHFRQVLSDIEDRSDVEEVWMQIYDLEEGEWPFSENVLIIGKVPTSEIARLSESLQPSEISELQMEWIPARAKHLAGLNYINLWWD